MNSKELFAKAVDQAGSCVRRVRDDCLDNETPCKDMNLRELLNHMVYELLWIPDILRGKTIAEAGDRHEGDVLHSDFMSAWQHAADSALVAVRQADENAVVHLSYGDTRAKHYINEVAADMLIHGWDVSRALSYSLVFNPDVAQSVYDVGLPRREEMTAIGSFGPAIEVDEKAPLEVRLLGLAGREV